MEASFGSEGTSENSPAFQRRDQNLNCLSPAGTAESSHDKCHFLASHSNKTHGSNVSGYTNLKDPLHCEAFSRARQRPGVRRVRVGGTRRFGNCRPVYLPLRLQLFLLLIASFALALGTLAQPTNPSLKTEYFDHDPVWEGFNNRVHPTRPKPVVQDFGYLADPSMHHASQIGGRITRASQPAFYAQAFALKTLDDKLTATGTFQLTGSSASSGVFFGWFNSHQQDASGRPVQSLGLDFDGEKHGARLAVRLISRSNKSCGTFITPFIPGKYRPTPIRNDGTRYTWTLVYDPKTNNGLGQFAFRLQSDAAEHEPFEGKWFTVDLPAGFKADGAAFDRFGLMNGLKPGGAMTIAFQKLEFDGKALDPSDVAEWIASGNRTNYIEANPAGAHDFGFSPQTSFAGGAPGEIGGNFWRSGAFAYYADRVGPLTPNQPLEARGRVSLLVGAPDSDMYLGWFNSAATNSESTSPPVFLGVHVGGPTRIGHYFQPAYSTGERVRTGKTGPVLKPNQSYDWSLRYEPSGTNGTGEIVVHLGGESVSLDMLKAQIRQGTRFDRFGLFTSTIGGQMVRIFFDDLQYTAAPK